MTVNIREYLYRVCNNKTYALLKYTFASMRKIKKYKGSEKMKEWKDIEKSQEKIREKYKIYKNWNLLRIMKKDNDFKLTILDICEYFDNSVYKPKILQDLYIATIENIKFKDFVIDYDYEYEILGEEYLKSIGAV